MSHSNLSQGVMTLDEVRDFWMKGLTPPFQVLSADEAGRYCRAIFEDVMTRDGYNLGDEEGLPDRNSCRHLDAAPVRELCTHPEILDRMEAVLGPDLTLFLSRIWVKEPGPGKIPWHQDVTHFPLYPRVGVSAWLALTPTTRANGCLEVIPGSHRATLVEVEHGEPGFRRMADPARLPDTEPVALEMDAGTCIIMDLALLHRSGPNTTGERRVALNATATVPFVKVETDFFYAGHRLMQLRGEDRFALNRTVSSDQLVAAAG